ncbi:MAG TPA: hypothetical protein VF401_01995 [Candidatus Saccharimonadales bacterium]
MFFHDLLLGLLVALIIVAPVTVLACIGSKNIQRTILGGVIVTIVFGVVNWLTFWWSLPPVGFSKIAIYHEWWIILGGFTLATIVVGLFACDWKDEGLPSTGSWITVVVLFVALVFSIVHGPIWNQGNATKLANETHVVREAFNKYPDTDANHILQVSEQTAVFQANQVLNNSADQRLSTIYDLGSPTIQVVDGHLYWIFGLEPTGFRNSNKQKPDAEVPDIVVVDAENPNAHAVLRSKDAKKNAQGGVGNNYHLKYYAGGYHWHKIERYLWSHGYRDQVVTGLTLEVNDQWVPYYTASVDKLIGGFHREVPRTALVINPQTGHIKEYPIGASLKPGDPVALPGWVDRVYTQDVVKTMLNWWGNYARSKYSWVSMPKANRFKVSGDPVLVYTKGGHPVWQAIMAPLSKSKSASYLMLFDARDNEARMYRIPNLTQPSVPLHVIDKSPQNLKGLEAVHLTLHKIYGHLTWVGPLIGAGSDSSGSASQGIALLPYDETNNDNLVIASDMGAALEKYRAILAGQSDNTSPEENGNTTSAEGRVSNLSQVVESGQTVFYFTLGADTQHVYRAPLQPAGSGNQSLELPFIKAGAKVRLTYLNTGSPRRDVGAYDDLGLSVASSG